MAQTAPTCTFCLTGPESSGKTSLSIELARHLAAPLVPEFARSYLTPNLAYTESDLQQIAAGQQSAEQQARRQMPAAWLVCDTDIQVIETWWWFVFGASVNTQHPPQMHHYPMWLRQRVITRTPRHYLLVEPDLPWEPDPLRENPEDRDRLFNHYRWLMDRDRLSYRVISGQGSRRIENLLRAVSELSPTAADKINANC